MMDYDTELLSKYFDYAVKQKDLEFLTNEISEDLELDLVFFKLDCTVSKIGKQYFYAKFRIYEEDEKIEQYKEFFKAHQKEKEFVLKQLSYLNNKKDYDIIDLIKENILANDKYLKYAQFSLLCMSVVVFASFFVPKVLFLLIPFLMGNLFVHYLNKNYVSYYNSIIFRLQSAISISGRIGKIPSLKKDYDKINLNKVKKHLRFSNFETALNSNEILSVLWSFIELYRIFFVAEIFSFRRKVNALHQSKEELLKMFEFIGKIDMSITLSKIQEEYETCKPIFVNEKAIKTDKLYHPFIDDCVKNNLLLNNKSAVITGSNMSGKTSFMRTIAVNALFAQNFGFCFADYYSAPKFEILSSISIQDDISENKSYYLEEVLRIKTFLQKREKFSLILIDEIFKGTNTKERIAISKSVLQNLNSEKNMVFATTHDLEIATFLKEKNYELYYFDEEINGNQLSFPFILKSGLNEKTNAIKILEMYGYPENVIKEAKKIKK